jgi:hypothetical protein
MENQHFWGLEHENMPFVLNFVPNESKDKTPPDSLEKITRACRPPLEGAKL